MKATFLKHYYPPHPETQTDWKLESDYLLSHIAPWLQKYVSHLHSDPDVAGDFILRFYERLPVCLQRFHSRPPGTPFEAYFKIYIKNEFLNYYKSLKIRSIPITFTDWIEYTIPGKESEDPPPRLPLHTLDRMDSIIIKLYHGILLNAEELKWMVEHSDDHRASALHHQINIRREKILNKQNQLLNHLYYLDHKLNSTLHPDSRIPIWAARKKEILRRLHQKERYCTLGDLSDLMNMSKASISRRLLRARKKLRQNYNDLCA